MSASMPTAASATTEAAIWERLIHPEGEMTHDAARHILQLGFSDAEPGARAAATRGTADIHAG